MGDGLKKEQSKLPLVADTWHSIEVIFRKKTISFITSKIVPTIVDKSKNSGPLDVDNIMYIGGVPNAYDATPK